MNTEKLTASKLKVILIAINLILFALFSGGFYFAQGILRDQANEVKDYVSKTTVTVLSPSAIQKLSDSLASKATLSAKIDAMFATSDSYNSSAISDLNAYANKTGITIQSTSFDTVNNTNPNTKLAAVTLKTPLPYNSLIKFLKYIEYNSPKMQVTEISLSKTVNFDTIQVDKLVVAIYVR